MQPRAVHAVLFDLDGTLLDSFAQIQQGVTTALLDYGLPALSEAALRKLIGLPGEAIVPHLGVPPANADAFFQHWIVCENAAARAVHAYPGAVAVLRQLRAAGYRLGIVTSRSTESYRGTPAAQTLGALVDIITLREHTVEGKPHPAPVLHALAQLHIAPQVALYLGDTCHDIEAGRRAGCITVLIRREGQAATPSCRPNYIITSLKGLTTVLDTSLIRNEP